MEFTVCKNGNFIFLIILASILCIQSYAVGQKQSAPSDTVELTSLKHWPQPTKQVPPEYPTLARQNNVEAEIMLSVLIGKDGKPKNIKVVNVKTSFMKDALAKPDTPVPDPKYAKLFHKPSIDVVMKWRFTKPLKPDSTTALVWVNVPLKYQLTVQK
ncbi:MAG: energy transducer TonB [Ignavibacteriales bacterium]|nr:energy transducer TonB [Ignavibacteriales bacterium]